MSQTAAPAANPNPSPSKSKGRAKVMMLLLVIFSLVGGAGFAWWYFIAQYRAETDNAYVAGNIVQVTAQTTGTAVSVQVNNTDHVNKGQVLVQLDDTDAQLALQAAEARVWRMRCVACAICTRLPNKPVQVWNKAVLI